MMEFRGRYEYNDLYFMFITLVHKIILHYIFQSIKQWIVPKWYRVSTP